MERKLCTSDLKAGMFVSKLDRPWLETPFLLQGFYIKDKKDLEQLRKHCSYVYIKDDAPSWASTDEQPAALSRGAALPAPSKSYEDTLPMEQELVAAARAYEQVGEVVGGLLSDLAVGKKLEATTAKSAVTQMTDSILRNPDAFMWLRRMQKKDSYSFARAMDSCIICIAFGRHLGLPKEDIESVGLGGLLLDVGKVRVPNDILLAARRLTPEEFSQVRRHVEHGVEIVRETPGIPRAVVEMVANHHERFDGSGYPQGLAGGEIPLFARIAGLVDSFSAITTERSYADAVPLHDAIKRIYDWGDKDFQKELLEQFIQTLGVYPTGTTVELSDGSVGVVISQSRIRRLRPRVMLILDADKRQLDFSPIVDLMSEPKDGKGKPLAIMRAEDPRVYGIDPAEYFL